IKKMVFFFVTILIILFGTTIYNKYLKTNEVYAGEENFKISDAKLINLDEIIKNNIETLRKEEYIVEDAELEYITTYENTEELYKGNTKVIREGKTGLQKITRKIIYENGEIISEEQVGTKVVKAAENQVIQIGTKEYKKPETSIITSNSKINIKMPLNSPSGISLEQFKKILTDSKDINKVFEKNAEYFYYIEKQYNINGIFVAAVGIHESAWATSEISKNKYNLFGYGAYDSNPYNGAYSFKDYSESIDLLARVFVKYYLNPKGTSIYGEEKAVGTYYNGATLTGINKKYATDENWANKVYEHMKYLYNKL
ncbi:MAG: G5 domain-containing protein, partial [Clostridia bacterium]|nr:G5 domain-containing protein [Clostridia bacterium]